jgi:hypothetical protein
VPDAGGTPEAATTLDEGQAEVSHRLPHLLPDGRTVIYTAMRWKTWGTSWTKARIFGQRLGEKERSLLAEGGSDGRWAPPGNLLFAREGRLLATPLDARTLRVSGKPVPIVEGVSHVIWTGWGDIETGAAFLDVLGTRAFAWVPGSVTPELGQSLVWVDGSGKETPIDLPKRLFAGNMVSPDGKSILASPGYPGRQLELFDVARGARREVTFEMNPVWAIWGPGPDRITFTSEHEGPPGIYSRRIDIGTQEVETLWKGTGRGAVALGSWTRDGKALAFVLCDEKTACDIWLLEPGKEPRPFIAGRFDETHPAISPDGLWLLYTSDEPGRTEVMVRPLTVEGAPRQVSSSGGREPLWSRDGAAIYYRGRTPPTANQTQGAPALFRVRVNAGPEGLALGLPENLFEERIYGGSHPGHSWDVAPDGRFLFEKDPDPAERRAWWEKFLSDRIRIDLGGLSALLSEAGSQQKARER